MKQDKKFNLSDYGMFCSWTSVLVLVWLWVTEVGNFNPVKIWVAIVFFAVSFVLSYSGSVSQKGEKNEKK